MIEPIKKFIESNHLLKPHERVVVALSGGADSVSLLHILLLLGYRVEAAHCNFHLRGEESNRDEKFVEKLCCDLNIKLHTKHFNTKAIAAETSKSIEMTARDLRYEWFSTFDCPIAVGHHLDDNAETLLLNLIRGTGINGLCAMPPSRILNNGARVIRPFLCITRTDIMRYVELNHIQYVTDSSNYCDDIRRNAIRHQIIPNLAKINPSIVDSLNRTATNLSQIRQLYNIALESFINRSFVNNRILKSEIELSPAPETVLFEILKDYGFSPETCISIFAERNGVPGRVYESKKWKLLRDRNCWFLKSKDTHRIKLELPEKGEIQTPNGELFITEIRQAPNIKIVADKNIACLDFDKIKLPLTVRVVQKGDCFIPLGMCGKKLVSDYMTDKHRTLFEKEEQLIVADNNNIVWLVNERIDAKYAITDKTKNMLIIKYIKSHPNQ